MRVLDPLVFTSLWAAAVAPLLMLATATATGFALPPAAAVLGFAGTLLVYGVDRLRDSQRDHSTTPARAAFVERHRKPLLVLAAVAGATAAIAALALPPAGRTFCWMVCAAALVPGQLHRRLKHIVFAKTAYVTLAWVAVCVGLPVSAAGVALPSAAPSAVVIGLAIAANLVASNLRDRESGARQMPRTALLSALALCAAGAATALWIGGPTRWLAPIALFELLAIAGLATRPAARERYGLVAIDGALWLGAVPAALLAA